MKDDIHFKNKISWYDIDVNGYVKGCLKKQPAVYILMTISDEESCYVGSSIQPTKRMNFHRSRILNWNKNYYNNNGSLLFYNSVLKHGWNNFKYGILEYIDSSNIENTNDIKKALLEKEQYYLDNINPSLNICKIAGSCLGVKHGISFSKNLSKARRGKKINVMSKVKVISNIVTSETRLKLSSRSIGVKVKLFESNNNLINEFPSMTSAAKFLGVSVRTIRRILNTGVSYDDYTYKFEVTIGRPIKVVNKENNLAIEYHSLRAVAKDMAVSPRVILNYINTDKLLKDIYLIFRI